MDHTIEFWLPFPPSTNRLWRSVNGRVILDADYKNWRKRAIESIQVSQNIRNGPVLGVHQFELKLSACVGRCGDADNRIKAVLDLAKETMLIVDDKLCRRASVEWCSDIDHDCLVRLTGEIAYKDQWEFASAAAAKTIRRKKPLPRLAAFGLPLRKLPLRVRSQILRQLSSRNNLE
jgi:crossover junction endodeoxyribonuclease RusA